MELFSLLLGRYVLINKYTNSLILQRIINCVNAETLLDTINFNLSMSSYGIRLFNHFSENEQN